jgi:hypothetical protein
VRILWAKGLNEKDIHKKCFLFTVESVCRVRRFTTGSRNSLKDVRKTQMMPIWSPCWGCDRSNCAAGGRIDSSWEKDNDRECSSVASWILHRTVKFSWSFVIQFAKNIQANWQEEHCFIMTMPDPTQPEQPRREFKNYSGTFLSIRLTARTWPLVTLICLVH